MSFLLIQYIAASSQDGVASKKPSLHGIDRFLSKASRFSAGTNGGMSASPPWLAIFRTMWDATLTTVFRRSGDCIASGIEHRVQIITTDRWPRRDRSGPCSNFDLAA